MRTIKFRGKKVDTGKWIYGDLLTSNGTECEISDWNTVDYSRYDVSPATVGQFTGLVDNNGNDIYEGDVLKSSLTIGIPNTGCCHEIGELFVVVCMLSGYMLVSMRDYCYANRRSTPNLTWNLDNKFLWNYHNKFEIVGNIHDNPELLKGGTE